MYSAHRGGGLGPFFVGISVSHTPKNMVPIFVLLQQLYTRVWQLHGMGFPESNEASVIQRLLLEATSINLIR